MFDSGGRPPGGGGPSDGVSVRGASSLGGVSDGTAMGAAGVTIVDGADHVVVRSSCARKVYWTLLFRPVMTHEESGTTMRQDFVGSPTASTRYQTGAPADGCVMVPVACALPGTARGMPGVSEVAASGVTAADGAESSDVPDPLPAVAMNR